MSKNGPGEYAKNGSKPPAPSCPDGRLHAELKAYLDGEMAAPRRWLLRRHLARCAACREEISELKRLGEDMKDLDRAVPRPELRARILASLPPATTHRAPAPGTLGRAVPRLALGGALAVLGVGAAFAMTHLLTPPKPAGNEEGVRLAVKPPVPADRYVTNSTPPFIPKGQGQHPVLRVGNPPPGRSVDPFDPDHLMGKTSPPPLHNPAPAVPEQLPRRPDFHSLQQKPPENAPVPDPLDLKGPVQLALVVKDTDSLYQQIQARVQKLGGRIVSLTSDSPEAPNAGGPVPKKAAPPGGTALPAAPQHGNILTLSVPMAHARALLSALKQLGTVMPAPLAPAVPTSHRPVPKPRYAPSDSDLNGGPRSRPENAGTTSPLPSKAKPASADKAKAEGSATIVLRLYRQLDPAH